MEFTVTGEDQRISALRIKLDFVGDKREYPQLSLLLWCLSVPEALKTGPISGEVRRRKTQMTPIPAKVLTVAKQSYQYRVLVQIELEKYLGSSRNIRFGESKPFHGRFWCKV